jgi:hypothetical protein
MVAAIAIEIAGDATGMRETAREIRIRLQGVGVVT